MPEAKSAAHPKSRAALNDAKPIDVTHLQVVALQEGGRHRAGRYWPPEAVTVPIDQFDDEQVEQLQADKKLSVLPISAPEQAAGDGQAEK